MVSPPIRLSQPIPPPRVRPPTPVWLTSSGRDGEAVGLGRRVHVAEQRTSGHHRAPCVGIDH